MIRSRVNIVFHLKILRVIRTQAECSALGSPEKKKKKCKTKNTKFRNFSVKHEFLSVFSVLAQRRRKIESTVKLTTFMKNFDFTVAMSEPTVSLRLFTSIFVQLMVTYRRHDGPGSAVSIATGYGLDGPGIECRCWREFPHLSRPTLGPTQPPV